MATVTLSELWVHLASDLDTFVTAYNGSLLEETGVSGEVRRSVNGMFRAVTTVGTARQVTVELPYLDRSDLATLEGWVGLPVMVRDPLGRKIFGMFFSVEASDLPIGDVDTVRAASLPLGAMSLTEAV